MVSGKHNSSLTGMPKEVGLVSDKCFEAMAAVQQR
jgi:hypothetical protein